MSVASTLLSNATLIGRLYSLSIRLHPPLIEANTYRGVDILA